MDHTVGSYDTIVPDDRARAYISPTADPHIATNLYRVDFVPLINDAVTDLEIMRVIPHGYELADRDLVAKFNTLQSEYLTSRIKGHPAAEFDQALAAGAQISVVSKAALGSHLYPTGHSGNA